MKFVFLTQAFYDDYKNSKELEYKSTRPYTQVQIEIDSLIFAIPLRSNISHNNVFWTNKKEKCGLDFSKTVVITDKEKYINNLTTVYIRPEEFNALRGKEYEVKKKLIKYIRDYKKAKANLQIPRNQMICAYSTLQYFEDYI